MNYQIGVIGSSEKKAEGRKKAEQIGMEVANRGHHLLTGGCTGLPYAAVRGAKKRDGATTGISPASSRKAHVEKYGYPTEGHDFLIFTGFGYKGRNVILVRSCDAVIAASGRMGTLNELTIAYGKEIPIGLLKGVSGASDEFERLSESIGRPGRELVSSEDPKCLVEDLVEKIEKS